MIINKINTTLKVATLTLALAVTSCGGDKSETASEVAANELKHGAAYNMFTNVDGKIGLFSMNLREIIDKMNLDNVDLVPEIAMGYAMAKPYTTTEYLGLNIDEPIYGLVTSDEKGEPEFVAYTIKMDDPKKFQGILDLTGVTSMIETVDIGGESFSSISERGVEVLWDDQDILMVASTRGKSVEEFAKQLLSFRKVDAPDSPELDAYYSRTDDVSAFYFLKDIASLIESNKEVENAPEDYLELMQDGHFVLSANFNAGELLLASEVTADKFKNSEYNMFNAKAIDPSFNKYLTNDRLVAAGMASVNMEVIANMIGAFGMPQRDLEEFKKETGMELTDFLKTITGEFSMSFNGMETMSAITDLSQYADVYENLSPEEIEDVLGAMNNNPMPSIIFTLGINDSTAIGNVVRKKPIVTSQNGYYSNGKESYVVLKEDKLIFTTSATAAAFFGSGSTYPSYELPSDIDGSKSAFGFMNTSKESLPNGFYTEATKTREGKMAMKYLNQLESITGEFEFDKMSISIKTIDKSKNILEYIAQAIMLGVKQEMDISSRTMNEEWEDEEFEAAEY